MEERIKKVLIKYANDGDFTLEDATAEIKEIYELYQY